MFEIARDLLTQEHERLLQDHYDDGQNADGCDGCERAAKVSFELRSLTLAAEKEARS